MTDSVAALSVSWTIVNAINDVMKLAEQRALGTRALMFLKGKVELFLQVVQGGLVGQDVALYEPAIRSFEILIRDILNEAADYCSRDRADRSTADMKKTLLKLNERLQVFFEMYTFRASTSIQLNVSAFAQPLPTSSASHIPLIPDDIQWDIMCQPETAEVETRPGQNQFSELGKDLGTSKVTTSSPDNVSPPPQYSEGKISRAYAIPSTLTQKKS